MSEDRDFLSRWSRRKQAAREAVPVEEPLPEPEPAPAAPEVEKTDAEILEELGLPDPDTLAEGSDFKAFMAKEVPARLRNRALRRLWGTNPVLANLDGLIDYGEDFTDAAMVVENLQTAYRVGRGFKPTEEELAEQAAAEAAEDTLEGAEAEDAAAEPVETEQENQEPDATGEDIPANLDTVEEPEVAAQAATVPRRRMRFRFESG